MKNTPQIIIRRQITERALSVNEPLNFGPGMYCCLDLAMAFCHEVASHMDICFWFQHRYFIQCVNVRKKFIEERFVWEKL